MGMNVYGTRFLLYAKTQGVCFSHTATLGRQRLHLDAASLRKNLSAFGYSATSEDIQRLLTGQDRFAEPFLELLGATEIHSFDADDYEKATDIHDFNRPISDSLKNRFTVVYDGGSLEHIFNFPVAIRNCMEMVKVGGHFVGITPANNQLGHGFYQFSPELYYRVFSPANGFHLVRMLLFEKSARMRWFEVANPERTKGRVTLINTRRTSLAIMATRIQAVPIFTTMPQQSDYLSVWKSHDTKDGSAPAEKNSKFDGLLRSYRKRFTRYNPKFFKPVRLP